MTLQECFDKTEGMISFEGATLLYEMAKRVKKGCIIEVGSYRGRSAVALGRGSLDGHRVPIYAIEPHEEFTGVQGGQFGPEDRGAFYRAMLDTGCYTVVRLLNIGSRIVAPNWDKEVPLLWIDGDHSYEGVKADFDCWAPHLSKDALVAFDDAKKPEQGPYRLVNELLENGYALVERVGKITVLRRR
jgi:hypothetical protein